MIKKIPSKEAVDKVVREIIAETEKLGGGEKMALFVTLSLMQIMSGLTKTVTMMGSELTSEQIAKATSVMLRGIAQHLEDALLGGNDAAPVVH